MVTEMDFLLPLHEGPDDPRFLVTGVGAAAAGVLADAIARTRPASVLAVGLAGGLDPLLHHGDLVVGARFLAAGNGERFEPEPGLAALAAQSLREAHLPFVSAPIYTVDEPLLTQAAKAVAFGRTGAAAVDMETHHFARVAAEAAVPFVTVRAIADAAGDAVPPYLAGLGVADRRTRVRTVISRVARHPGDVAAVVALARAVRLAGPRLRTFVEAYLRGS
jgi:hypothetical protein